MKRYLIPIALLAFALTVAAQTMRTVNDTNEMVMLNPQTINTNLFVHVMPPLKGSVWTFIAGDTTGPDTNHLDSVLYPGLGRWVWNNIGTNYFETLIVSNLVAGGDSLWTNLGGILQPQNLTLPVMLTNQLQFGPGTTNVLARTSGNDLTYTNGAADVKFVVLNGSGKGAQLEAQASSAILRCTDPSGTVVLRANTDQAVLSAGDFYPVTDLSLDSGNINHAWKDTWTSNSFVRGFIDATLTNYVRLKTTVSNTTAVIDFQSITNNVNGPITKISVQTNGVEVFNVTGTGGPSSAANWTAVGATDSSLAGTAIVGTGIALTNGILSVTNGASSIRFETNAGQANPCISFLLWAGSPKTYLGPSRVLEFRGGTSLPPTPPYDLATYFDEGGSLYSGTSATISNKRLDINGGIQGVGAGEGCMLGISSDVNGPSLGIEAHGNLDPTWFDNTAIAVYDLDDIVSGATPYSPGFGKKKWALDGLGNMYWGASMVNGPFTNATISLVKSAADQLTVKGSFAVTNAITATTVKATNVLYAANGSSTAPGLQFPLTGAGLGFYAFDAATISLAASAMGGANPPFSFNTGGALRISQYAELVFCAGSSGGADDAWMSRPAAGRILVGRSGSPNTLETSGNFASDLSVGSTTYFNAKFRSQTNQVAGALTFAHCTNGVDGLDITVTRWLFNSSGSDQTLTFPIINTGVNGWRTNVYSAVPPAITNGTIMKVILDVGGPTDTLARQTNCYVKFEYYQ